MLNIFLFSHKCINSNTPPPCPPGRAVAREAPVSVLRPAPRSQVEERRQLQAQGEGSSVGDVALELPRGRGGGGQKPRHILRHGVAHDQCRGFFQVSRGKFCNSFNSL